MLDEMLTSPPEVSIPLLIVGITFALFGWILYWGGIHVVGGVAGVSIGGAAGYYLAWTSNWSKTGEIFSLLIAALIGLILGVLAVQTLHNLLFFLSGFALGSLAAHVLIAFATEQEWSWASTQSNALLARLLIAGFCGILLMLFGRYLIVMVTATAGSALIFESWPTQELALATPVIWIVAIILQISIANRLGLFGKRKEYSVT